MAKAAWTLASSLVFLVLLLPGATACNATGRTWLGDWEPSVKFFAKAEGAEPFLSDTDAGGAASFTPASMGPTTGVSSDVAALQWGRGNSVEFTLKAPVSKKMYLNLSKPVVGALYFTTTVQTNSDRGEALHFRVEVFQASTLVGGADVILTAEAVRLKGFVPAYLCFRPEVAALEAGQPLSLRVTRIASLADFTIGTGGNQQSFLEFHYFDTDPIQGALYVERGKMVRIVGNGPAPEGGGTGTGLWALALLAVPFGAGRRPRVALVGALLMAVAMGGCLGAGAKKDIAGPEASSTPSATYRFEDLPPGNGTAAPGARGLGAIDGLVVDEQGIALTGATALVLGTSLFATTDSRGEFHFKDIAPNAYVLHVDREGFQSFEGPVEVVERKATKVTVTMAYLETKQANDRPHLHDDWGADKEKTLADDVAITPEWAYVVPATGKIKSSVDAEAGAEVELPAGTNRKEECPGYGICQTELRLPPNAYILPGTKEVVVALKWSGGTAVAKEAGLKVVTATNTTKTATFVPREQGKPFRIPIFPNEADFGHQRYTDWRFTLFLPPSDATQPFGPPASLMPGEFTLNVKISKGTVPFERAHGDFWGNATELPIISAAKRVGRCINCNYPRVSPQEVWSLGTSAFVPPETRELRGVLTWQLNGQTLDQTPWSIVYRGATVAFAAAEIPNFGRPEKVVTTAGRTEFTITPKEGEADQYYQVTIQGIPISKWVFLLDDKDLPSPGVTTAYRTEFTLTVTAYR